MNAFSSSARITSIKPSGTVVGLPGRWASGGVLPSPPYGNRFQRLTSGDVITVRLIARSNMEPLKFVRMLARQHGIHMTNSEADYLLWNRTPFPMLDLLDPTIVRLLRTQLAELEMFGMWRGRTGLAGRILEKAILEKKAMESDGE